MRRDTTGTAAGATEKHMDTVDLSTPNCACASWEGPVSHIGGHHHLCVRYDSHGERQRWTTLVNGLIDEMTGKVESGHHYQTALKATGRVLNAQ